MTRIARKIARSKMNAPSCFDASQHFVEDALRGRAGRNVRAHVRRMEPVIVRTPRWSAPACFLEDLALDLAVGEPGIGCRTVNLQPLKGRKASESWQFTLHVFAQLGRREWRHRPPRMVADRGGFRFALMELIREAHQSAPHPVALLAHGAEYAPVEIIEDLAEIWGTYCQQYPVDRRCTLLLAGTSGDSWWPMAHAPRIDLVDYGSAEAAAVIVGQAGDVPFASLRKAAHFSGGVPGIVSAVGERVRQNANLPHEDDALFESLGGLADEIRGAVDIVHMDSALADRLYDLVSCESMAGAPEVDDALILAGLVRPVRSHGQDHVELRAPAIATLLK